MPQNIKSSQLQLHWFCLFSGTVSGLQACPLVISTCRRRSHCCKCSCIGSATSVALPLGCRLVLWCGRPDVFRIPEPPWMYKSPHTTQEIAFCNCSCIGRHLFMALSLGSRPVLWCGHSGCIQIPSGFLERHIHTCSCCHLLCPASSSDVFGTTTVLINTMSYSASASPPNV